MFHYDIGETKKWGFPINDYYMFRSDDYPSFMFEKVENIKIDVILIDGRFRVACGLKAALVCNGNPNIKLFIHDWQRVEYHILLKYYEQQYLVGNLAQLKIKSDFDLESAKTDFELYKYKLD